MRAGSEQAAPSARGSGRQGGEGGGDAGGEASVGPDERDVGRQRGAAGGLADAGEQEWGDRLGGDALGLGGGEGAADVRAPWSAAGISASAGIGLATSWPPGRPRRARMRWARAIAAGSSRRSGAGRPLSRDQKAGSASWPKAITGTPRVSSTSRVFGRSRIALAPEATTVTGVSASSIEVGGDVEARLGAAVHAADAAGGEDLDAGQAGADHRGGNGGGAGPAFGECHGEVGARELADVRGGGEGGEAVGVEADADGAVHHRDRRRGGAEGADLRLNGAGGFDVRRRGHPVGDDRRTRGRRAGGGRRGPRRPRRRRRAGGRSWQRDW